MKHLIFWLAFCLFFAMVVFIGCSTPEHGPYNRDKEQDLQCYSRFGGQMGYCDKGGRL